MVRHVQQLHYTLDYANFCWSENICILLYHRFTLLFDYIVSQAHENLLIYVYKYRSIRIMGHV